MPTDLADPVSVVSPATYALILSSPRLKQLLLPEGLITSPYKVLDYHQTLVLGDKKGAVAVFRRTQQVQFQQDGVGALLDHFWGDGVMLTHYTNSAGALKDCFKDEGRHHLVVRLQRPMVRGETLAFTIQRTAFEAFLKDEEWEDTTIDHPIERLRRTIVFPKARPCQAASLVYQGQEFPLHVLESPSGGTLLRVQIPQPRANTPYIIRWSW